MQKPQIEHVDAPFVHKKNTTDFKYILGKPSILYPCPAWNMIAFLLENAEVQDNDNTAGKERVR